MSWKDQLQQAEFAGVAFDVQRISDELARRVAQYKYPYVDGADLEDRGREPRTTTLTAVFLGPEYESDLGEFMLAIDTEDSGTFKHPILGQWKAKVRRIGIAHEDTARDMATVDVEVIEDGTRTQLPTLFSLTQLATAINTQQVAVTAAGAALPSKPNLSSVTQALQDLNDAVDDLQDAVDDAVATVENAVNDVRARAQAAIDAVRNLYASTVLEAYSVVKEVNDLVYKSQQLAESATAAVPTMVEHVIGAQQSAAQVAHELYGDASRATEFEDLNRLRHPGRISSGTRLRVYSK
jgi:prophage DNA circulation protein